MSFEPDGGSGGDTGSIYQRKVEDVGMHIEVEGIRRFWVRKTEPWAATRRDSKREVRRVRNWVISRA